ncbi:MAG: hypothetical protein SGPRY_006420, partial [Prymnesium sp.]
CSWCEEHGSVKKSSLVPACSSDALDDVAWKDCSAWCDPESKAAHCSLCKCKACGFCACEPATADDAEEEQCQSWSLLLATCSRPALREPPARASGALPTSTSRTAACASARLATSARKARLASGSPTKNERALPLQR